MNLSRRVFSLSVRAWLLISNFLANALALLGLSILARGDDGWAFLLVGSAFTVFFIAILATPDKSGDIT